MATESGEACAGGAPRAARRPTATSVPDLPRRDVVRLTTVVGRLGVVGAVCIINVFDFEWLTWVFRTAGVDADDGIPYLWAMMMTHVAQAAILTRLARRERQPAQALGFVAPRLRVDATCTMVVIASAWVASALSRRFNGPGASMVGLATDPHPADIYYEGLRAVLAVVVGPFCEEMCCRSFVLCGIHRRSLLVLGALGSTLLFGVSHVNDGPAAVVFATLWGSVLCAMFALRRSLWPIVLGHAAWNAYVTVIRLTS